MTAVTVPTTAADLAVDPARTSRTMPLFAATAGITGFLGSAVLWLWVSPEIKQRGPEAVVEALAEARMSMHIGTSITWLSVFALIGFTVHYLRFLARGAGDASTLVHTARLGLTAGIGAMVVTTSLKAVVVGGIPGGIDAAMYDAQDVSTLHLLSDQLQWVGWMGVVVAMAVTAVLALRQRVLPRWFGILSGAFVTLVAGMTLVLGLPYSAGLAAPIWLLVAAVVLFRTRRREG